MKSFDEWKAMQRQLPAPNPIEKTLLIVRMDDIGDYLLFRNQLKMYKESARWKSHCITLLGNSSWKAIFTEFDADAVDRTIWVNKNEYLTSADYRSAAWEQLRKTGFETVIAPSRTRPLLLDDLCMLAAAPVHRMGAVNTYVHESWNRISDSLYQDLFKPADVTIHEFQFNAQFAAWSCGVSYPGVRPCIENRSEPPLSGDYIVCFVGANTRSKCWPLNRWIDFITLYGERHAGRVIVAGQSAAEVRMARTIEEHTGAESIAGKVSLPELLSWVAGARVVITNDTMAAHLSVSSNRPTLIIANGVNYSRFTDYAEAGISNVSTVYPELFNRRRRRLGDFPYDYTQAVSADIASITARVVFERMAQLLQPDQLEQTDSRAPGRKV